MKKLALAVALAASWMTFGAMAADSTFNLQPATSTVSTDRDAMHARHQARTRQTLAKKQCSDMPGDEKENCEKNAQREARAAYKEAMPASAGAGG